MLVDAPKITEQLIFYENNNIYFLEKQINADKPWCFKLEKYSSDT